MNIAIIGSGNVGSALAASIGRAGHTVVHTGRGADAIQAAAAGAEVIIIAVPYASSGRDVAVALAPVAAGKIVIDTTNPIKPDRSGLESETGSAAEDFAAWLPGARVVKAFNTMFASVQGDPGTLGVTVDALFATDDESARTTVAGLLASMGFRPVYVGPLARAHELEAIAYLNITLQMQPTGTWRTAVGLVEPPEAATGTGADDCMSHPLPGAAPEAPARGAADERLPALYLGHGAPPLLEDPVWPVELREWAAGLPRPKSILIVSAHWESAPITLGATTQVPLTYDFYGFPRRYYEQRYDAPGAPELAAKVRALMPDARTGRRGPDPRPGPRRVRADDRDVSRGGHPGAPDVDAGP